MSRPLRILFCAFLILGLFVQGASAADISATVKNMQTAYAGMQSFRADFTQQLLQRESGVVEKRQGVILFQKPLRVRWETAAPHAELLMVTDKEIWNYLPDEELAYRYSRALAEDSRSLIQVITGQSALSRDFDVESAQSADDGNLVHLLLYPKEPTTELTEAQIWLDPSTSLICRVMVMDFYGNTNTIELQNLKPNASVADKDFQFTPPRGTEVEDHVEAKHPTARPLMN
ncbi:LolA family protein [Mailhella sp.]|uniref:LolA family protein n=1 Tax=Mailhella sp. TaxID=1981029 RepID=UPI003AB359B1